MDTQAEMTAPGASRPTRTRDSNLELFRIVAMLLIVAHHYVVNSGLIDAGGPISSDPFSWRSMFLLLYGAWGKTCINCFVLITGYFMCKNKITLRKFVKLVLEWLFYLYLIHLIFLVCGVEEFSLKFALHNLLPITEIYNAFTPCYVIFFLMIPFLTVLVNHLTEEQHVLLLALLGFIYVFFGTVHRVTMNYVSWFAVLFLIGSYIRLYPKRLYSNTKALGWIALASFLLAGLSVVFSEWLGMVRGTDMTYYFVTDSNTLLAVLCGVSWFLFFKSIKLPYNKFINVVAASTFGVLCIHTHSDAMRQWLWQDVCNNVGMYGSPIMLLHAIGCVLLIFAVCTIIDALRIRFIEEPFFGFWDRHWPNAQERLLAFKERALKDA